MTTSIEKISELTSKDTLKFDLISKSRSNVPSTLSQEYLFMPSKMKLSFLFAYLQSISTDEENEKSTIKKKSKLKSQSQSQDCVNIKSPVIIFVNTCKRCEEIKEFLLNLNFNCVALHSNMNQNFRSNSLSQFKNFNSKILVATDIASRGLDIPNVGYVINFDVPKVHTDYLHRVGRTARAGEAGKSVTFINPNEVDILKDIESYTNTKMNLVEGIKLDEISKNLNKVSKALRLAQIKLLEEGFDDTKSNNFKRKRQN
jgi:ATP-dependent RNA helicase DDX49/DBP8